MIQLIQLILNLSMFTIMFNVYLCLSIIYYYSIAQDIFWKLHANGYIFSDAVEQLRCEKCARLVHITVE